MTILYIDADACPVKQEAVRVGERHKVTIMFVSNSWMRLPDSPYVERKIVSEGLDEADNWIAEHATTGDVVVTADVPLASRCVDAGALVIGPTGKPFREDAMGIRLAMRDLTTQLREAGEIRQGAPAFTKEDRSRFLNQMEPIMRQAKRAAEAAAQAKSST
ncbi:MAG: YaiI/YqxD family protein [Rhodobacteraceae bacterium]|nr:YaiI/YqxD family protein [Paracoccaceae bacterium]